MPEAVDLTEQELVAEVRSRATELVAALALAQDNGVSHAILIPELVAVFKEAGFMP